MTLVLKNTFLDIAEPEEKVHARRSSSAPPAWKPLNPCHDGIEWDGNAALPSDVSTPSNWSTAESDDESSPLTTEGSVGDLDGQDTDDAYPTTDYIAEGSEYAASDTQPPSKGKVTLCLDALGFTSETEGSDYASSDTHTSSNGKFKLCLDATVESSPVVPTNAMKTKLSSKAPAFAPGCTRGVPDHVCNTEPDGHSMPWPVGVMNKEIHVLVQRVREVLQKSHDILSVNVSESSMGGTTSVHAVVRRGSLGAVLKGQTALLLQNTLLATAEQSESTYILGYKAQPFQDTQDGFKATVGCVTALQEHSICWDTYELGFCPRRNTCRWCHPLPKDLMQLVVTIEESK